MSRTSNFEQGDTIIDQAILSAGKRLQIMGAAQALLSPLSSEPVVKLTGDLPIHLLDVERIEPSLETISF